MISEGNLTKEHLYAVLQMLSNQSNYDYDMILPTIYHEIPARIVILAYGLIVMISLIGNLLVCKIAFTGRSSAGRNNRLRTTTDLLIGSLAVSDLIMTCINIPVNIVRLILLHWPFGSMLCVGFPLIQTCCVYVSTFTMAAIAMHRWRTVSAHHSRSGHLPAPYSNRTIIGSVWLLATLLSTPTVAFNTIKLMKVNEQNVSRCRVQFPYPAISLTITVFVFVTQYLLPLIWTAALYIKIAKVVSRQGRMTAVGSTGMSISGEDEKRRKRHLETKRRRIVMLSAVVAVFAICWLPIHLYHLSVDSGLFEHRTTVFLMVKLFLFISMFCEKWAWLQKSNELLKFHFCRRALFFTLGVVFCCS